jgi:hypothetical protein
VGHSWVIFEDIGLGPSLSHQADYEFDGKPGPADHGFTHENVGREGNARMFGHDREATLMLPRKEYPNLVRKAMPEWRPSLS